MDSVSSFVWSPHEPSSPGEVAEAEGKAAVFTALASGKRVYVPLCTCLGLRDWGSGFKDQLAMSTDMKVWLLDTPPGLHTAQAVEW